MNKFLLIGDEFMPKLHLTQPEVLAKPGFTCIVLVDHLLNLKNEYKNLKKQETRDTLIRRN